MKIDLLQKFEAIPQINPKPKYVNKKQGKKIPKFSYMNFKTVFRISIYNEVLIL